MVRKNFSPHFSHLIQKRLIIIVNLRSILCIYLLLYQTQKIIIETLKIG